MKLRFVGKARVYGFWTTRFVEADMPEAAELAAVTLVRDDDYLKSRVLNAPDDSPLIFATEIDAIAPRRARDHGAGYTFFREDEA